MNGTLEQTPLRQICWWPPNGICQAGKPKNTIPSGFRNLFMPEKKAGLSSGSMCSITSWISTMSKRSSRAGIFRKFPLMNSPGIFLLAKYSLAFSILLAARSMPVTQHPASANGRRFPPSPQPISSTRVPAPTFLNFRR